MQYSKFKNTNTANKKVDIYFEYVFRNTDLGYNLSMTLSRNQNC